MQIDEIDIEAIRSGKPPLNPELLSGMTLGSELWLERFQEYYLANYIASGGSKVKLLVGGEGSGKTHLVQCIQRNAKTLEELYYNSLITLVIIPS